MCDNIVCYRLLRRAPFLLQGMYTLCRSIHIDFSHCLNLVSATLILI